MVEARLLLLSQPNAAAVIEAIFTLNPEMQRRLEVILWDLWITRNKMLVIRQGLPRTHVTLLLNKHMLDFAEGPESPPQAAPIVTGWMKPKQDFIKVNFDAAFKLNPLLLVAIDGTQNYSGVGLSPSYKLSIPVMPIKVS